MTLQREVREADLDVILGSGFNKEARRVELILPGWQLDDPWANDNAQSDHWFPWCDPMIQQVQSTAHNSVFLSVGLAYNT